MGLDTEKESTSTPKKELSIKEIGSMEWEMVMVLLLTRMALFTKDNGREEWSGEMERWLIQATIIMKANGPIINETAKELCTGSQVTKSMKEIGLTTSKVVLALIFGLMALQTTNFSETGMLDTGS